MKLEFDLDEDVLWRLRHQVYITSSRVPILIWNGMYLKALYEIISLFIRCETPVSDDKPGMFVSLFSVLGIYFYVER